MTTESTPAPTTRAVPVLASAPGSGPAGPTVSAAPGPRAIPRRLALSFIGAYFGIWLAGFGPIILLFPLKAGQISPGDKAGTLSLVLGVSAIFGILATPIAGRISDRTTSRFGRRRPWLMGFILLALVGLAVDATASTVPVYLIGVCIGAVAFAGNVAVILSVLPEHVQPARRGAVSGALGIAQSLAVVVGVGLTGALSTSSMTTAFLVPGIVGMLLMAVFCRVLPDRRLAAADRPPFGWGELRRSFWITPGTAPGFGWAWASRFFIFMAFASVVNYQVFYLTDQLGIAKGRTNALVGIGTGLEVLMVIVSSILAGIASDRLGRRRVFAVVAAGFGVVGLLLVATATTVAPYLLGLGVVGLGQGAYYAVDLALVSDLLPDRRDNDARDLGVFSLANQVPQSLAPAIAPLFLAVGFGSIGSSGDNYTALFTASAVFAVLGALTVSRVRGVR